MGEPTIYKPSIYNGAGIYNNGAGGGDTDTVEIGGKTYHVVTIDGKKWLGENLSFIFPEATINPNGYPSTPAIWYNLISQYAYGYLYNYYAAKYINDNNLIPGWRVADIGDYQSLINYVGGLANVPQILYEQNWKNVSSDLYGFTIKPGGIWVGTTIQSQGISLNSGIADFVGLTLNSSSQESHLECILESASVKYNAIGAGRSIRLIKNQ